MTELKGELTFDDKVVQKIVGTAIGSVDGLLNVDGGFFSNLSDKVTNSDDVTKGIDAEVGKEQVAVDMKIVTEYGKSIPDIYKKMGDVIQREVKKMTGLDLVELNVETIDIKSVEQYKEDSVTLEDKAKETGSKVSNGVKNTKDKAVDKVNDMTNNDN